LSRICVIGNYSGRNAGDAAILGALLNDLSDKDKQHRFIIPTINKGFIYDHYSQYNIIPVGMMPWNFSLKIFGWPIIKAVMKSDLILVTDAILFDYRLFNPLYNYLSTLSFVLPFAAKKGKPVIHYNVSLGPVYSSSGRYCLYRILRNSELIIVRDDESVTVLEDLYPELPESRLIKGADCALNSIPSNEERLLEIKRAENILDDGKHWMSVNISQYLDVYVRGYKKGGIGKNNFLNIISSVLDRFIQELDISVLIVVTHPMDLSIANELQSGITRSARVRMISNRQYSYRDLTAVFSSVQLHLGMRTHSLILASSVLTPVVGLIATPKNRGYMKSIEQHERMIEFRDLSEKRLYEVLLSTWHDREKIREELKPIIDREKLKARKAATYIDQFIA
jgi:polysaccharide pyruvyl transferase WcaK-like protein